MQTYNKFFNSLKGNCGYFNKAKHVKCYNVSALKTI